MQGLLSRKASYLETLQWRSVGKTDLRSTLSSQFYDTAIQVPGLLERCDRLRCGTPLDLETINALLNDLAAMEAKLKRWLADLESSSAAASHQIRILRPINHFTHFTALCPERTLTRAYHFPSFHIGYLHSLYWMCMHALRTGTQQVTALRCKMDPPWTHAALFHVDEDELLEYTLDLCRCMPFFCEPLTGSIGHIAIFLPMRCAAFYFATHGQWIWLKWIGAVKVTVFTQGLSPPKVGGPILPLRAAGPRSSTSSSASQSSGQAETSTSSNTG